MDTRWTLGGQTKVVKLARGGSVFKGAPRLVLLLRTNINPWVEQTYLASARVIFGMTVKLIFQGSNNNILSLLSVKVEFVPLPLLHFLAGASQER